MACNLVRSLLPLHAGGDLSARQAAWVESHVAACASCREELDGFRRGVSALATYRREGKPLVSFPDFWAGLRVRIREEEGVHSRLRPGRIDGPSRTSRFRASIRTFGAYAAAGFFVTALGVVAVRNPDWFRGDGVGNLPTPAARSTEAVAARTSGEPPVAGVDAPGEFGNLVESEGNDIHYHLPPVQLVQDSGSIE